jgi:uncharacterized Fe-S cluster-containing radical SAM superfamily enzyme
MAKIEFEGLVFMEENNQVIVTLYTMFEFRLPKTELAAIGDYKLSGSCIEFKNEKDARRKLLFVLGKHIMELKTKNTGNTATYVHKGSGIPLVGNISFGIVDRGSSLLELKPVTSCNLSCVYCSLSEGTKSRMHDFVVEREYLVEELAKVVGFKKTKDVEVHIGCQGEPLFYSQLTQLVQDISQIKSVSVVSMDTNAVLLTKKKAEELFKAGMNRFNISLNGLDQDIVSRMAGMEYPMKRVMELCEHIAKLGARLVIAPVWLPGVNDSEIPKLIEFAKKLGGMMGIQNYLEYKHGRRPAKQATWEQFYERLSELERVHKTKLKLDAEDFNIRPAPELPKPFKDGEILKARIICPGRYSNEAIVAARERSITVITPKRAGEVKFQIVRTKHNIYLGKAL